MSTPISATTTLAVRSETIKAPLADDALHASITGVRASTKGGAAAVRESLAALQASDVAFECRTTAHPALLSDAALEAIGHELASAGVACYALQIGRPAGALIDGAVPAADYPQAQTLQVLRSLLPAFEIRRSDRRRWAADRGAAALNPATG